MEFCQFVVRIICFSFFFFLFIVTFLSCLRLSMLFVADVINLVLLFLCYPKVFPSMETINGSPLSFARENPLLPSFFYTYSLSTPFIVCQALEKSSIFFILWYICPSSSVAHFRNGPEYLTRRTSQVFIPLIKFLLQRFVSRSPKIFFRYFSFIFACLVLSASNIPTYL